MLNDGWSWSTLSKESFPKLNGNPKFLSDERTCVLPVKLEPGKTYAIWFDREPNVAAALILIDRIPENFLSNVARVAPKPTSVRHYE